MAKGMVRKIDDLGRLVIPTEIRKKFNLSTKDSLEMLVHDDEIILRKWQISCIFCGSQDNLNALNKKMYCEECAEKIKCQKG